MTPKVPPPDVPADLGDVATRPHPLPKQNSPYGPQHGHVDRAAGGADSSPLDNQPTGAERQEEAEKPARQQP